MFLDIKLNGESPIYIQIKNYIKEMILKGILKHGEKLPSTRELSLILRVSRNTIITAYELLQDEGYIYILRGKGTFINKTDVNTEEKWCIDWGKLINAYAIRSELLDIMKQDRFKYEKGMISFKSISPDENLFNMDDFKKAFLNRISIEGNRILNYGYAKGYKPLIDELFKYMSDKGVDIENKDILITNGFTEAFDLILSSLTNPGDNILTENPTHNTAIKLMKLHNLNIIGISMKLDGINLEELSEKIRNNNIKLAYIIPSYHNPTGIVMSLHKRMQIYSILKKYKIPIVEDGFNEELSYIGAHIAPIAAICGKGNGVIYAGSFSKILFPGLRLGWILADKELVYTMESVKRSRNIHTSFLDQAIFYEYLKQGSFEKYLKKVRREYREKYKFAIECIKKYIPCKYIYGEGGTYLFVKLEGINSKEVLRKCYYKDVIFTLGDIFYVDGNGQDTFRLGIARNSKIDIEKGFKIIGDVIKSMS